mmetsp:Transcript_29870/g.45644  ORF Transcript_29870/g.45644 Transcript_29870/m.45644 type:complete len:236 (-) Transcript_29870:1733-2440(-)
MMAWHLLTSLLSWSKMARWLAWYSEFMSMISCMFSKIDRVKAEGCSKNRSFKSCMKNCRNWFLNTACSISSNTFWKVARCSSIDGSESSFPSAPKQIETSNYVMFFMFVKVFLKLILESKSSSTILLLQYLNTIKRRLSYWACRSRFSRYWSSIASILRRCLWNITSWFLCLFFTISCTLASLMSSSNLSSSAMISCFSSTMKSLSAVKSPSIVCLFASSTDLHFSSRVDYCFFP